jgi:DNA replication ATP-dependent helicase Dna2
MVQKIQHSLVTQRQERVSASVLAAVTADCPSSSSPLPDTGLESFAKSQVVSPLQARKTAALVHGKGGVSLHREPALEESLKSSDPDQASGAVKQIGDPMDPGAAPTYSLRSRAPLPAYKRPSITRVLSQQQVQQTAASTETPVAENSHDDEFGDDEFDLTVDDIDALCSQIPPDKTLDDIPKHPGHTLSGTLNSVVRQTQPLQQAPIIDLVEDDEDEFGGDIDEDTLVQAEYSASQAFQVSHRFRKSP